MLLNNPPRHPKSPVAAMTSPKNKMTYRKAKATERNSVLLGREDSVQETKPTIPIPTALYAIKFSS